MTKIMSTTAVMLVLSAGIAAAQSTTSPSATPAPSTTITTVTTSSVQPLTSVPTTSAPVTNWYKQPVYDQADSRIGEIDDVLVERDGKVTTLIIGVGGFLGIGEKHVAVPFDSVKVTSKDNNKWYLVMNSTKEALTNAPGYRYDRSAMVWMPAASPATTGSTMTPATRSPATTAPAAPAPAAPAPAR
jgi:sporulation protein YlmC with PRC-barrel domain